MAIPPIPRHWACHCHVIFSCSPPGSPWWPTVNAVAVMRLPSWPSPALLSPDASPHPVEASPCFRYFLQMGKKKHNPSKISCYSSGKNGHLHNIPIVWSEFCSTCLSGKKEKKKAPKLWSLGRWSGSWSSPLNFFIDSKVHASTCIQSTEAAGRTKQQRKIADQNLLNCPCTGAACFSSQWQSLVIDNVLPRGLNPFFS